MIFTLPESLSPETAAQAKARAPIPEATLTLLKNPRLLGYVLTGAFSGAALCSPMSPPRPIS